MRAKQKNDVTPKQVALALLIVGTIGSLAMDLLDSRGWMATVFGVIAILGVSGWMATWRNPR